jgi:U3 small nucleolar RNA-associated protein 3
MTRLLPIQKTNVHYFLTMANLVFEQRDQIMLDGSRYGRRKDEDYMSASDEEILPLEGLSDEDEDEEVSDGQDDSRSDEEEDDEEKELEKEAWGTSRKAYYGADEVSDEEDEQLEEQEAERLQKKHLSRLRPEDFLDTWADKPIQISGTGKVIVEEVPAPDLSKLSKSDLLKLLKTRHPDVLRLAKLYEALHPQLSSLSLLAQRPFHPQNNVIKLKFAVLSVLLSSIAVYFAVRADAKQRTSTEKKLVSKISELETTWSEISSIEIDENALDVQELMETEERMAPEPLPLASINEPKTERKPNRKRQKTMADESDSEDDIASALAILKKSRSSKPRAEIADDFADPTTLHPIDALEKSENKKSLRFYTSQIEQKLQKRREKYSGDIEVFKERRNDRNERLIQEAQKRGRPVPKDVDETALDDEEPVSHGETREADSDEDYYDFIAAKTAKKKEGKKAEYENSKAAAKQFLLGQLAEEEMDESGKRLITRQIEKNKGLMPHRSKDVRNPRVKKRKKYEKKKKALKGRQQVYQLNDRRRGAYGGEESGISKNVVKGVKLG